MYAIYGLEQKEVLIRMEALLLRTKCMDSHNSTGASCSKLTTSLVNVSLKFQTLISNRYANIFAEKM